MKFYYVYKEGVYGHGVQWIGMDFDEACAKAGECAEADADSYHTYNVHEFEQGEIIEKYNDHQGDPWLKVRKIKEQE